MARKIDERREKNGKIIHTIHLGDMEVEYGNENVLSAAQIPAQDTSDELIATVVDFDLSWWERLFSGGSETEARVEQSAPPPVKKRNANYPTSMDESLLERLPKGKVTPEIIDAEWGSISRRKRRRTRCIKRVMALKVLAGR